MAYVIDLGVKPDKFHDHELNSRIRLIAAKDIFDRKLVKRHIQPIDAEGVVDRK